MTSSSSFLRRPGATVAGIFGLAAISLLLLCGAGTAPIENFAPQGPMQSDLNAGGHNVTNAATVQATNFAGSGGALTNLTGTVTENLSGASSATLASLGRISSDTLTLQAGSGAYVVNRALADAGCQAGDLYLINVNYPASMNPTLNIYDNSTTGTLLQTSAGSGVGGVTTLEFVFNGTSWVHYAKGAVLTKNLGSGEQSALTNAINTSSGLVTQAGGDSRYTLAGNAAPYNLFTGPFPAGTEGCYTVKSATVAAGATVDVLPLTSGAGYVSSMFLYLTNTDSYASLVNVYLDGSTTAAWSVPLQDLLAADGGWKPGALFAAGPYFSFGGGAAENGFGGSIKLAVPFKTSIHITITNASATAASFFTTTEYRTAVAVTSVPLTQKLFASYQNTTAAAPNSVVTLVNATGLNPGQLAGFYLSLDGTSAVGYGFLEGKISVYTDGASTPAYQSSGTEDSIEMPGYFNGFASGTCDSTRGLIYNNIENDKIFRFYKMWPKGPITFTNAIKITWDAGESSSFTGTVNVNSTSFFYTQ
jgi:hypothetical protein